MRVLITGGTGFIGSRLALHFLERGDFVRVLGKENNPAESENRKLIESKGAEVVLGSVTDRERMFELVQGIDWVFHLAAAQHEANIPDQEFWEVNVTGTQNLLEASVKASVKRFIHGSTIGVYGSALQGVLDEQSALRPDNIYGVTKLGGERTVISFRDRLPVVIIRISETYGPGDRRLLKLFKAIKKRVFFVIGSGKNVHHPIYIDDLIQGLLLAANVDQALEKIFVMAGKEVVTTTEMVEIIAQQLGVPLTRFYAPLWPFWILAAGMEGILKPFGIQAPLHRRRMDFFKKSFEFDPNYCRQVLGFIPVTGFRQGIAETAKWYNEKGYL